MSRQMEYKNAQGQRRNLTEPTVKKLVYTRDNAPYGKRTTDAFSPKWREREIDLMEKAGMWRVTWTEPTEAQPDRGWMIEGLTELGEKLLAQWEAGPPR